MIEGHGVPSPVPPSGGSAVCSPEGSKPDVVPLARRIERELATQRLELGSRVSAFMRVLEARWVGLEGCKPHLPQGTLI
jgi:hypothetical protein